MQRRYAESNGVIRHVWDVERIWKLADKLEAVEMDIEKIVGLDQVTWFSPDGDQPTIRIIADHARRIMECDLSYPPILTYDFRVFDGMHRIARHLMEGKKTIIVKRFEKNPDPDLVEDVKQGKTRKPAPELQEPVHVR